jgi:hypothetical protein
MRRSLIAITSASLLASLAVVRASPARADDPTLQKLPGGLALVVDNDKLFVTKGRARAPLSIVARMGDDAIITALPKAAIDTVAHKVTVTMTLPCGETTSTWTFDQLEARLANVAALAAHRKKDYATAATGFATAVKLDPAFDLAAENLASALALGGKPDEAVAALAPWIASNPIWVAGRVAVDPELAALRTHATITALAVKQKGTVVLKPDRIVGDLAYSPTRGELAIVRVESSWGAGGWTSEVEIFDAKTGAMHTTLALSDWSDAGDFCGAPCLDQGRARAVKVRTAALQGVLRDFGFSPVKGEANGGVKRPHEDADTQTVSFVRGKIGVAINNGTASVLRGNTVLGTGIVRDKFDRATLLATPKAVVLWSHDIGHEGCQGTDPTDVSVIPLP